MIVGLYAPCVLRSMLTAKAVCMQIDENVERELINHRTLVHPNIVRFREVSSITVRCCQIFRG